MIGILWSPKLSKQNYASMPVWITSSKRHYLLARNTGNWTKLEDVALGKVCSERECLNALRVKESCSYGFAEDGTKPNFLVKL
jgi:hypothetical protein